MQHPLTTKQNARTKIAYLPIGGKIYAPLDRRVLAVLSRRHDGWCIYAGAVPGENHDREWQAVALSGTKMREGVARAMVTDYFKQRGTVTGVELDDTPYAPAAERGE